MEAGLIADCNLLELSKQLRLGYVQVWVGPVIRRVETDGAESPALQNNRKEQGEVPEEHLVLSVGHICDLQGVRCPERIEVSSKTILLCLLEDCGGYRKLSLFVAVKEPQDAVLEPKRRLC